VDWGEFFAALAGNATYLRCEARDIYVPSLDLESRIWDARRSESTSSMQSLTEGSQKLFGSEFMVPPARERLKTGADSRKGETNRWARRVFRPTTQPTFMGSPGRRVFRRRFNCHGCRRRHPCELIHGMQRPSVRGAGQRSQLINRQSLITPAPLTSHFSLLLVQRLYVTE
jgi:hypothetical protein